jgi:predicted HicB family RNase H-like nuclease
MKETDVVYLRIQKDLKEMLAKRAKEEQISVNKLVEEIVILYLNRRKPDLERAVEAAGRVF